MEINDTYYIIYNIFFFKHTNYYIIYKNILLVTIIAFGIHEMHNISYTFLPIPYFFRFFFIQVIDYRGEFYNIMHA